jgi:hypothetical protein
VKGAWLVGAGFLLGWLTTKTWNDPACQMGLAVFLAVTAALVLVFAIAVTAGRKPAGDAETDDGDEGKGG